MMKTHLRSIQRNAIGACLYTLFLLLFSNSVTAQTTSIDSLEHWVKAYPKRDTVYLENLMKLERLYYVNNQKSKIGFYINEIIKISKQCKYERGEVNAYRFAVLQHIQKGSYEQAIKFVFEIIAIADRSKNMDYKIMAFSFLGYIYYLTEEYEKSIYYYNETIKLINISPIRNPKVSLDIIGHTSNLTMSYNKIKRYKESLKLLLGCYDRLNTSTNRSEEYYYLRATTLSNLSDTYYHLKEYDLSNKYLQEELNIVQKHKIKVSLAQIYISFCKNYIALANIGKASEALGKLSQMEIKGELDAEKKALFFDLKQQINEKQMNFENAYLALKEKVIFDDSLQKITQQKEVKELSIKYETEQKELKIKQLQQEKVIADSRSKITTISTLALLVILMGGSVAFWQVRNAKQKAEEINQLKNKLFSIIAHDLRSPANNLKSITSTAKFVNKSKDPKQMNALFSSVSKSAITLSNLVDNLLHWSLLQQNTLTIEPTNIPLATEVAILIEEYDEKIKAKKINITKNISDTINVLADRITVQIILRNLLDNSLKFTSEAGNVVIWAFEDEKQAYLHISDTGIGIEEEMQKTLFEPQIKDKKQEGVNGEKGTGIGLYLCRELAQLNKGNLELVESIKNSGTHLLLTLPSV